MSSISHNEVAEDEGDSSRLLLLLTDILGDLNILESDNKTLWTPESLKNSLLPVVDDNADKNAGGLDLAQNLLSRLQSLEDGKDETTIINLSSWSDLFATYKTFCPPWVSAQDISEKPLIAKLEHLAFLATSVQSRMLRTNAKISTTEGSPSTTTTNNASESSKGGGSGAELPSLPPHLTEEQRKVILECFTSLKADYDKRRIGMKQRLDILVSNFEADNADDKEIAELKTKLLNMSFSSSKNNPASDLTEEELCKHFTTAHSKGSRTNHDLSSTASTTTVATSPLENLSVVDRGGRPDEIASRVSMPEWSSKT